MDKAIVTKTRAGSISEGVLERLGDSGYHVSSFPTDLDVTKTQDVFEGDEKVFVNCIGKTDSAKPDEWEYDRVAELMSVNLISAIALTTEFVKKTQGTPGVKTIVHIGSLWSRKHSTNSAVYTASKAGLAHYVACIAKDLDIHYPGEYVVVGVHPGNVQGTPLSQKVQRSLSEERGFSQEEVEELYEGTITPYELGDFILDLIGNKWVSGENIYLGKNDKR